MDEHYCDISGYMQKNYLGTFGRCVGIGYRDFSQEEFEFILSGITTKIEGLIPKRKPTVNRETWINTNGDRKRSSKIEIRSADGVVSGTVEYTPAYIQRPCELSFVPTISVKLKYCPTEKHPGDVEEYTGLVRLVREMGFRV